MKRFLLFVILLVSFAASLPRVAPAQEWTRFRGPNGSGQSDAKTIPVTWSVSDYNWKAKLPGKGNSSPVLWGDKIFLLSADPEDATRHVSCIDAGDGTIRWTRSFESSPHEIHRFNGYASSTPAVDADHVYVTWSNNEETTLMALDHDDHVVWRMNLGSYSGPHGFATSPVVYEDMVLLSVQQREAPGGGSFAIAVDCKTGAIRWKTPRKSNLATHATPCVYQPPRGPAELIFNSTAHGIASIDPKTGRENWALDELHVRTVGSPLVANGLIIGTTGNGAGGSNYMVAVRPGKNAHVAFKITSQAPYVPTPVAHDGLLFLWYDKGIVTCVDTSDGKVIWKKRVGGNFFGSPVRVGDRLYCISEAGDVVVLSASRQFKQLGKNELGEGSRSTPAIVGGTMYLRTYSHLISIGGKAT